MDLGDITHIIVIAALAIFGIPVLLAGVSVVVVVANRAEPDASGRRPLAVYLYAASFVAVFLALFGSYGVIRQLCRLIDPSVDASSGDGGDSGDGSDSDNGFGLFRQSAWVHHLAHLDDPVIKHPLGDSVARGAVAFGVVVVVAGVVLLLHLRAAGRISHDELATGGPVARVRLSYVAAVSFVCVVTIVITAAVTVYDLFGLISPTVFDPDHPSSHIVVLRGLVPAAYLAVAAAATLVLHMRSVPAGQRPDFSGLPALPFPRRQAVPAGDGPVDLDAPLRAPQPVSPSAPTGGTDGGEVLGSKPSGRPRPKPAAR
jgi:heme/copper-type cytochrome/quinol oxidase subunit 2